MYETSCILCNPSIKKEDYQLPRANQLSGSDADPSRRVAKPTDMVGIYIGESNRSVQERSLEHLNDAKSMDIVKHWMERRIIDIRPTKSLGLISGLMHQIKLKINIDV